MKSSATFIRLQQQPPPDDIYDIVVLAPKDPAWPGILLAAGILLLLIAIGIAAWWWLRRRNITPVLTPRSRVLQRIHHLELRENTMEPNQFARELSDALKDYFVATYRDPVRYETAEEFLVRSRDDESSPIPDAARTELRKFLQLSEALKFGNTSTPGIPTPTLLGSARATIELCDMIGEDRPGVG